jgi:hypothetical protein
MKTLNSTTSKVKNGVIILPFIIGLFMMASCQKEESVQPSDNSSNQSAMRQTNSVNAEAATIEIPRPVIFTMVNIEHQSGWSTAPAYSVTIKSDGEVIYRGSHNVRTMGAVSFDISKETLSYIQDMFYYSRFYQIRDTLALTPDVPVNLTFYRESLKVNGKTLIDENKSYPAILIQLRQKVEETLNISKYVKGTDDIKPVASADVSL